MRRKILIILFIFLLGLSLRMAFSPAENETADPFEILTAAKTLYETGRYLLPGIGSADLKVHYTFAGWPVGFPLMLTVIFKFFGYSEFYVRLFTIFLSSLTIVFVSIIANLFFQDKIAYLTGLLMATHPLLVSFSGRIFTNNPSLLFLIVSLTFLLLSVLERDREVRFVGPSVILGSKKRLLCFLISFLFLGYLLTIRDTEAIFIPAYLYVLYKSGFFLFNFDRANLKVITNLFLMATAAFVIGYIPSIYYNYQNYGVIITSTHYQYGGRLDFNYMLTGSGSIMGLPGAIIIIITGLIYCFPIVSLFFVEKFKDKNVFFFVVMFILMFLPLIVINGSYAVTSTGASPRYILPLIPVACILTAYGLTNLSQKIRLFWRIGIFFIILVWQLFLTYPLPALFKISPKFAYAAHYAPVYQIYPFENYPAHINALSKWVKNHTPKNSVIIATSSNPYHFYYYAERDVITFPNVTPDAFKNIIDRPTFLVEDHEATYNAEAINKIKDLIKSIGLDYSVVGEIKLFSPKIGHTKMHIYQITHSTNK